jgi:hypothetical protein
MISVGKVELVALGARHRADRLATQAGYTLGLADEAGEALAGLLEPGFVEHVRGALQRVQAASADRAVIEAESKDATAAQNEALREAKLWRRKLVARGTRARRAGARVPDGLTGITRASTVAAVLKQVGDMLGLASECRDRLGPGIEPLLEQGRALHAALAAADATQEQTRLAALPDKVREHFAAKGELYLGLKIINDAARELHADDAVAAARFNLKILYRKAPAAKDAAAAPPA